jgi:hypothetical protein
MIRCPKCGANIGPAIAAHAGKATSAAKAEAARRNAKLGGWPKGKPRKKKKRASANAGGQARESDERCPAPTG